MKYYIQTFSIAILLFITTTLSAQFDIIFAKDATKLVNSQDYIFLSCRNAEDYTKVHVTNAINIELKLLFVDGKVEGSMKSTTEVMNILGSKGLDPAKTIIIYDNGKYVNAGYYYWLLKYLGYPNVKILDGHLTGWRTARGPVTKTPSTKPAVKVNTKLNPSIFADYNYVKGKLKNAGTIIVDVQSASEYAEGHIPGAINMENKNFFVEATSVLKSKAEIEKVLADYNISKDKEIILYCASSARAGTVYLAMVGLGYKNVKIYDGGYNEWKTK
jgi:thiosulfate/3-mercaptopyruvate sulfurtransferase